MTKRKLSIVTKKTDIDVKKNGSKIRIKLTPDLVLMMRTSIFEYCELKAMSLTLQPNTTAQVHTLLTMATIGEVYSKLNSSLKSIHLSRAHACACILSISMSDLPFMIELKSELLKAL
jgi:hypothetical protein